MLVIRLANSMSEDILNDPYGSDIVQNVNNHNEDQDTQQKTG